MFPKIRANGSQIIRTKSQKSRSQGCGTLRHTRSSAVAERPRDDSCHWIFT